MNTPYNSEHIFRMATRDNVLVALGYDARPMTSADISTLLGEHEGNFEMHSRISQILHRLENHDRAIRRLNVNGARGPSQFVLTPLGLKACTEARGRILSQLDS